MLETKPPNTVFYELPVREDDSFVHDQSTVSQHKQSLWKLKLVKGVLFLVFLGIGLRLVQIQIVESPRYRQIAQRQYEAKVMIPAVRGSIYDRNGNVLASNSMFISFAADPKLVGSEPGLREQVASRLARVFQKPAAYYLEKLESRKRFVWLERQVSPEVARKVRSHSLLGVIELREPKRLYHYPEIAGALVGFTDVDNTGLSGIELQFDRQLRGTNGYMILQRDGHGRARPTVDYLTVEPQNGDNVFLTIDLVYQSIAEQKLKKGVEHAKAQSGLVVMMAVSTGEILAMAQYPPLDPTSPGSMGVQHQKLRAVTDMFEPGSVFKIVTASAALEDRLVRPTQRFNGEQGTYSVKHPGGYIRVIKDTRPHDMLTFQQAMELSSNIVMAKVSDLIGADRLYMKARSFGFGSETGVEYPGEMKGDLKRPVEWSGTTLNTMAYGYEVGVTPLQLASAYTAVANDGILMKPLLVSKIVTETGEIIDERQTNVVRRVMTAEVAATLKQFLEGVVERGTGASARIAGIRIGGKTGTSRKYVEGNYQTGSYTASFVGFFPLERPEIVCLVMLDNPDLGGYTGGAAAAPIFREIVQHIITSGQTGSTRETGILTDHHQNDEIAVPAVTGLPLGVAKNMIEDRGLVVKSFGSGIVVKQAPAARTFVKRNARITLVSNGGSHDVGDGEVVVPDLRGMSLRRAMSRLAVDRLGSKVHGSGLVVDQMPEPGSTVSIGASIVLVCESSTRVPGRAGRALAEKYN